MEKRLKLISSDAKDWEIIEEAHEVHVMPVDDDRQHPLSTECPCNPRVDWSNVHAVVTHNSFDHREYFEPDNDRYQPGVN